MSRRALLSQLLNYREKFPEEAKTVERLREFITERENCFRRSHSEGHVTGSAWVVDKRASKVLLTHHRKLNRWLQLGGHADGETDILSVALREAQEESGLEGLRPFSTDIFDIDIHLIPERGAEEEHFHYDIRYALQCTGSEDFAVSGESHDLRWVEIEKVSEMTEEESMRRMVSKWRSQQVYGYDADR